MNEETKRLVDCFHTTFCKTWPREEIEKDKLVRFAQAYLMMAGAKYRPAAPSDGFGNIRLTKEEIADRDRLIMEAAQYAVNFQDEDDDRIFRIGCSNYSTNRAFVLAIEAARCLAGGGDREAVRLLKLATKEIGALHRPV